MNSSFDIDTVGVKMLCLNSNQIIITFDAFPLDDCDAFLWPKFY